MDLELANYLEYIGMPGDFAPRLCPCEVCEHGKFSTIREWVEVGEGHRGRLPIVACDRCGFLMQNPRFSRDFYQEYYAKHYRKVLLGSSAPEPKFVENQVRRGELLYGNLERYFDGPGTVLDVGSSCGGMLAPFIQRGWSALGVDPDLGYVSHGRSLGFPVVAMDAEQMTLEAGHYSFIMIMGSLEHVYDPNIVLQVCRKASRPGALLLLEGWGLAQGRMRGVLAHNHRRYLTANSAELLMIKHGWQPILTTQEALCGPTRPGSVFCLGRATDVAGPTALQPLIDGGRRERPQEIISRLDEFGVEA